jgi:hypothetical protein
MTRRPNPWIAVPALTLGVLAGALGWIVTDVSCRVPTGGGGYTTCPGWAATVAIISFLVATIGVAVILSLVYRSLAEWKERSSRS